MNSTTKSWLALSSSISALEVYPGNAYVLLAVGVVSYVVTVLLSHFRSDAPLVGSGLSYFSSIAGVQKIRSNLYEGYAKYPNSVFCTRIYPLGLATVVTNKKLIDELRNARDDALSIHGFAEILVQTTYTLGPSITKNRLHVPVLRTTLTRALSGLFPDIVDEMVRGVDMAFPPLESGMGKDQEGWMSVPAYSTVMDIVCRMSASVIVGNPLCRNDEYLSMSKTFTINVMKEANKINLFPRWLHPIVGPLIADSSPYVSRLAPLLRDLIRHRREGMKAYGHKWADAPNDYLAWIMAAAPPGSFDETNEGIALRVLHINFAAIHTSSVTFTQALYYLALHPSYQAILRQEAEAIIAEDGWTKAAMQKMRKADSFLKESARLNPFTLVALSRIAVKDHTFSDGTTVPKGSFVTAPTFAIHMDESIYPAASEFKPWRFSDIRGEEGEETRHQYIATSDEFLSFGFGKHACPGRFFAVNEIKALLSHLVLHFDMKLESSKDGKVERPANVYSGTSVLPNVTANVLFKRRA